MDGSGQNEKLPRGVWWRGGGALGLGAGIVAAGAIIPCLGAYAESIFVNVGTAIALVGPLYVGERFLSRRIDRGAEAAEAARTSADDANTTAARAVKQVDELSVRVQERLEQIRSEQQGARQQAAAGDRDALVTLYGDAASNHSIDRLGLRLPAPNDYGVLDYWIRVRAVHRNEDDNPVDLIEMALEHRDPFEAIGGTIIWSPGESPEDVFVRWAEAIQGHGGGHWLGDAAFRAAEFLAAIEQALSRIVTHRTGSRPDPNARQIASLVNDQWAVTREGLDSLITPDVWAEHDSLVGQHTYLAFQRLENQVKLRRWSREKFQEAFNEAERVHAAMARQGPGK